MTASPGRRPAPISFAACSATSLRICAAILLPSRTVAMVVVIGIEQFNHKGLKGTRRQVTRQNLETILDLRRCALWFNDNDNDDVEEDSRRSGLPDPGLPQATHPGCRREDSAMYGLPARLSDYRRHSHPVGGEGNQQVVLFLKSRNEVRDPYCLNGSFGTTIIAFLGALEDVAGIWIPLPLCGIGISEKR